MSDRTCDAPGCERPHLARGLCKKHYQRVRSNGTLNLAPTYNTVRGAEHVAWLAAQEPGDECLYVPWTTVRKYPRIGGIPGSHMALILDGRPRPPAPNDNALHSCDDAACVNRRHLRWGSVAENNAEASARGRSRNGMRPRYCARCRCDLDQELSRE